jgi:hypothetical protein
MVRCGFPLLQNAETHGRMARDGLRRPKVSPARHALPFFALQGGWPVAIFDPFGHPTPYAYAKTHREGNVAVKNRVKKTNKDLGYSE